MRNLRNIFVFLLILFISTISIGCSNSKDEEKSIQELKESTIYKEDDIKLAMDVLNNHFEKKFIGVHLTKISYVGDEKKDEFEIYKKEYAVEDVIVLTTDFYTDSTIGDVPFDINSEYKDYPWILVKDENKEWIIRSWGY